MLLSALDFLEDESAISYFPSASDVPSPSLNQILLSAFPTNQQDLPHSACINALRLLAARDATRADT